MLHRGRDWLAVALGLVLASGGTALAGTTPPTTTLIADDARTWQRLWHPAFEPRPGASTRQVNVQRVDDRFAIVGGDDRGAVVWWSDDGLRWRRTPRSKAMDRGEGASIAGARGAYVLGGHQMTPTPRGRLWRSTDGRTWAASASKLPPGSEVRSVAALADGSFAAYGYWGRNGGCWMGTSADRGATWDFRWEGDWDPGLPGGCATSVVNGADRLLARIDLGGISESRDGIRWQEVVSAKDVRDAQPKSSKRYVDVGLVPLGDGRYVLGGKGKRTLVWSRTDGLQRIDGPVDWSGRRRIQPAFGPERAVAVRWDMPAPLVSPPADVYADRWVTYRPACRPGRPTIKQLTAMRPRERLECHGGKELTFRAWVPYSEYGGTCPFGAPYDWMICWNYWLASGPGPSPGHLNYGLAPDAKVDKDVETSGAPVRVTGHFDDPAAAGCPEPGWNGQMPRGWRPMTRADFVEECRQMFIVTEMRRVKD